MSALGRNIVGIGIGVALLAGCGGSEAPIGMQRQLRSVASRGTASNGYKVLYSFDGVGNDKNPEGGLVAMNGKLYGTTDGHELGTVFTIDPMTSTEKVLYAFQVEPDGSGPVAGLTPVHGTLYGTTVWGGSHACGTVFKIEPSGYGYEQLYSFGCGSDGVVPSGTMIAVNGMLYGTTYGTTYNGAGMGTVFSITTGGIETVLHDFSGYPNDGKWPSAGLLYVKGRLYGTTTAGGTVQYGKNGAGTVFSVSGSGAEAVVYSFDPSVRNGHRRKRHGDGSDPTASLIDVNGTLYGVTMYRGTGAGSGGCGTAFSISGSGVEKEIHAFHQVPDGCYPAGSLLQVGETFYGTTSYGGAYNNGTVFSMTRSGKETVLHSFGYGADGSHPSSALINFHGTLYGTTSIGGDHGYGIVFAFTP
jgi:uncharacterized repeat protein (TIGR03803 family)